MTGAFNIVMSHEPKQNKGMIDMERKKKRCNLRYVLKEMVKRGERYK